MTDESALLDAVAAAGDQPQRSFAALADFAAHNVGHKLFTLTAIERETGGACRIFSNMPQIYPVSGRKAALKNAWSAQVIDRHQTFVANDIASIAEVFGDHELIRSLGCEAVINIPVVIAGAVVGTANLLHEAGYYTPERVAASEALKLPATLCFLLLNEFPEFGA